MILEEFKNIKSDKKELKKFGITIGGAFLIVSAVLFIYEKPSAAYFMVFGFVFQILAQTFPLLLLPLQKVWMGISVVLGFIMTRVILSILFYLMITPINFISRLFGKDFLDLKIEKSKKSYWNLRDDEYEKSSSEKQF
ncbi:MAG: SxtJ family membrane protein [Melioribacteraceae bacterium]|jgi:hypothetical protein|nr:SxtJ family membrane protein [Melioribacteraceae bacterium]